jgi:hypothetical protein
VAETVARRASINDALANDPSRVGRLTSELELVASTKGVKDVGTYASRIERVLGQATRNSATVSVQSAREMSAMHDALNRMCRETVRSTRMPSIASNRVR